MSRAAEMRGLIQRWEASGLSQREFTEREGVSYSAFQYWRRRLRDMPSGDLVQLDPIRIVPERVAAPDPFEIRTSGGMTVSVPAGFDEVELRRLLGVLAGC